MSVFSHSPRVFTTYIGKTLPLFHRERGEDTAGDLPA